MRPRSRAKWMTAVPALMAALLVMCGCTRGGEEAGTGSTRRARVSAVWGVPGVSPGEFTTPRAIALGKVRGKLKAWVVDKSGRIQRIDAASGRFEVWWRVPNCEAGKPTGLTIAPAPSDLGPGASAGTPVLYVAHTHDHKVLVYALDDAPAAATKSPPPTPSGVEEGGLTDEAAALFTPARREVHPPVLASWGSFGQGDGQFIYPTDVAVLTAADGKTVERIYVGEYGDHDRISVFDAELKFLFSIGTYGASASAERVQFDRPQGLEIDEARRELVVVDSRNHRIGRFTLDGALIAWIGSPETSGPGVEQWRYPWGLALPGDGTALVVEFGNNRLHRVELATGRTLGTVGGAGRSEGLFAQPWAVAVSEGTAFVVDAGNHRVQVVVGEE
ncbi:MAG: hypothetical protein AB7K52_11655 [Phycisphaerales bacterium]